jgi:glycosyltransferase involved in cell wall biosynthesis
VTTATTISIVIPVYNGGSQLGRCLEALLASDFRDYEILVVDDGSTDESARVARAYEVPVLELDAQRGPAAARNRGVVQTRADLILFIDADVVVRPDTLERVAAFFRDHPGCAAVFGSYDDSPDARNFVSQFKNLRHHFVHQQSAREAATFWAGCGAIRRQALVAVGGFDELKYARPSIEDIELGQRLHRGGFKIILDATLQVKHLKRWTFFSLLRTDILHRALPWSKLIVEEDGMIDDLNLRMSDRVSAALVWPVVALCILSYFYFVCAVGVVVLLTAILFLNAEFYRFLEVRRGRWFAIKGFGMLLLHYFYSANVFALSYCTHTLSRAWRSAPRKQTGYE